MQNLTSFTHKKFCLYADGKCQCRKSGEADGKRVEVEVEDGHVACKSNFHAGGLPPVPDL